MEALEFGVDDALALATFDAPAWSADGRHLGYVRFRDGERAVVARPAPAVEGGDRSLAAPGDDAAVREGATALDWRPDHPDEVAVVADGVLELFDAATGDARVLSAAGEDHAAPTWAPDGDRLAVVRDDTLWVHDVAAGSVRALSDPRIADTFGAPPVAWSADGRFVATLTDTDDDTLALTVYEPGAVPDGERAAVAWQFAPAAGGDRVADAFAWAGDRLVFAADAVDGTARTYRVVAPGEADDGADESDESGDAGDGAGDDGTALLSATDERGLPAPTVVGHESGRAAVLSARTGHHHPYVVDVAARAAAVDGPDPGFEGDGVVQVTDGAFEARGDATDEPAFDEGGDRLAVVTNEHDPGERRLHVAHLGGDPGEAPTVEAVTAVDDAPGNAVHPAWEPDGDRVACVRAGRTRPADVHVFDTGSGAARRVSESHPDPAAFAAFPDPEPVTFESGHDGAAVYGYLYAPPGAEAGDDRPAVVWAHGGPVRQMRRGFHHMRSYAGFHAFDHVLLSRGYAVLELNYRGGIGYGREYETGIHRDIGGVDVADCVDAAGFLRERPEVGDAVGLWGLSYGGFLAAAVATDDREAFDCAVDFAGVWDWADWVRYASGRRWGAGRRFRPLFGGHPDDGDPAVDERYARASPATEFGSSGPDSPATDAADPSTPFFALHGTDDPNVPFDQMDGLVDALVGAGRDFEMAYYPAEDHMFESPATWRDAMGRVLPFLEEHLRG
jgi:dipeptidyl aminopeptidase/acylaminoacyl peptidase